MVYLRAHFRADTAKDDGSKRSDALCPPIIATKNALLLTSTNGISVDLAWETVETIRAAVEVIKAATAEAVEAALRRGETADDAYGKAYKRAIDKCALACLVWPGASEDEEEKLQQLMNHVKAAWKKVGIRSLPNVPKQLLLDVCTFIGEHLDDGTATSSELTTSSSDLDCIKLLLNRIVANLPPSSFEVYDYKVPNVNVHNVSSFFLSSSINFYLTSYFNLSSSLQVKIQSTPTKYKDPLWQLLQVIGAVRY